ncbi:MAG: hypothetical protein FJ137_14925 [Deltaproteobacteria bacterium]|nr:hypothetical protein [Deltaproteobacteria bacterium]
MPRFVSAGGPDDDTGGAPATPSGVPTATATPWPVEGPRLMGSAVASGGGASGGVGSGDGGAAGAGGASAGGFCSTLFFSGAAAAAARSPS